MRYKSFRIRNFKGIKDTVVKLRSVGGAGVFAFVGLNESGKTTVLEAIHSFSPDSATSELLSGSAQTGVPFKKRVPRHQISYFTGEISVEATLELTELDKSAILTSLKKSHDLQVQDNELPDELKIERHQAFKNGDFQDNYFSLRYVFQVRTGRQKKWREPTTVERIAIRDAVYALAPTIAYFPTFVFNFPERIYLTDRGGRLNRFYRQVFQDILDHDGQGYQIGRDIVARVRGDKLVVPWTSFLSLWGQHDSRPKIQHVMDRSSSAVTRLVFGRWNKIFGEDVRGKEVVLSYDVAEGEIEDDQGNMSKTNEHDVFVQFQIRDGTRRFPVNDRSLGFRWFFAFMLFTQFRVARSGSRAITFLFDEPASNLHAAAQQKLIDSFPEIATGDHVLAYTTHSHYMIEPKWLEQTFIVTNRSDSPPSSIVDATSLDDESLDISVSTYREFVNSHPGQTSYFQPILDRLQVVPSRFDIGRKSIIVEGKSDYYILRYAARLLSMSEPPLLPALGSGTFDSLMSLHLGWNLDYLCLLDSDHQGAVEKARYEREYGVDPARLMMIGDLCNGLKEIESLLDKEARDIISAALSLSGKLSKGQIAQFFQERLAADTIVELGEAFRVKSGLLLAALAARLAK